MTVHLPDADRAALADRLLDPTTVLVACLCAEWCGTCKEYFPKFTELASTWKDHVFAWIDIEEHPDLLEDHDVEDFPTLLIQTSDRTLFYGPMLPHIGHLDRFLATLNESHEAITGTIEAPAVRGALAAA